MQEMSDVLRNNDMDVIERSMVVADIHRDVHYLKGEHVKTLVSPDLYEAFCDALTATIPVSEVFPPYVISEAKLLGKPVLKCEDLEGGEYAIVSRRID